MSKQNIYSGKLTLSEIKEYFSQTECSTSANDSANFSDNSSIDLNVSFEELLQRRKLELEKEKSIVAANKMDSAVKTEHYGFGDETIVVQAVDLGTDDSFLENERMCNITTSNNELIDLTDSFDENMEGAGIYTAAATVFNKAKYAAKMNDLIMNMPNDETMLNDVEAPSCFFENSMLVNSPAQPSSNKMFERLRPSTIIEESQFTEKSVSDINSVCESLDSFKTAETGKTRNNSGTESEFYKTADEQTISEISSNAAKQLFYDDSLDTKTLDVSSKTSIFSDDSLGVHSVVSESYSTIPTVSIASSVDSSMPLEEIMDEVPEEFNDTLEEMDFLMKQGMKLLTPKANSQHSPGSYIKYTPTPKKNDISPATRNNTYNISAHKRSPAIAEKGLQKGAIQKVSPSINDKNFKQPLFPASRIPKSSIPIPRKYDNIVSPIRTYINNTPECPLYATKKGNNDDLNLSKLYPPRQSIIKQKPNESTNLDDYVCPFPRKAYISAPKCVLYEKNNNQITPGGPTIKRLIGTSPTVITCLRRKQAAKENVDITINESFADLSIVSGDVSLHVVENAKRC